MSYKSILTVVSEIERAKHPMDQATVLARLFEAHCDVLCLGVDRSQSSFDYGLANEMLLRQSLQNARDEGAELHSFAEDYMSREALSFATVSEVTMLGDVPRKISRRGRFCDLMVLGQPYGSGASIEGEAIVEAGLFESAAPVLMLPDCAEPLTSAKRILIGWNESAEALAAVRKAMPFLKKAETVHVVVIDPPTHGPDRSDPGGLLCQMLARHGISCEVNVLAKSLPRTADVMLRHAADVDADLLVMGAYGHSRFREAILGGATRHILEQADRPVLMAHS